ncbi:MAG: hypothetical protein DSY73_07340 [Actinobacteria bacterium]|nr:MAG: hypothetical protein DSY73_07340 [Actinomycetota bacterium]
MAMRRYLRQHLTGHFTGHPASVGETYTQHLARALRSSWSLAVAAVACTVHAFVPALFPSRAGDTVNRLHDEIRDLHKDDVRADDVHPADLHPDDMHTDGRA